MAGSRALLVLGGAVLAVLALRCGPGDPAARVGQERARWEVTLLGWATGDDGAIALNVRVGGPPNSALDRLTFRIALLDAEQQPIDERWHTVDLSTVPRGGPKDLILRLDPATRAVDGIAVDLVLRPTPEQRQHIPELQGR